jgi:hypothetical protein
MQVVTDGTTTGQGFYSPAGVISPGGSCSVSLYLMGETGTVAVSAASNPGGVLLQAASVQLTGLFTRVTLDGLEVSDENSLYILVTTPTAQDLTFFVAAVQIEPEGTHTDYCDGDQTACFWTGTAGASTSYRPVEFGNFGALQIGLSGSATAYIPGGIFDEAGAMPANWGGSASATVLSPVAALKDFAVYELTDPDPAMTYAYGNTAGMALSTTVWNRPWASFVPPRDYPVSGGQYAWRRAAFAGFGYVWNSVPASGGVQLTKAQIEMAQLNGITVPAPSAWDYPRAVHTLVKPDMLNYITNPSFEISTAGWSATGNATLTQDLTSAVPSVSTLDSVEYNAGTASMLVTLNDDTGTGASISVPYLIPGQAYTASAWVMPGASINDIAATCANGGSDVQNTGQPYGGNVENDTGFGSGYYGGVAPATTALATGIWSQVIFTFTAAADTETLSIAAVPVTGASYSLEFWIDAVMISPGDTLAQYFDGSFGEDAFWEGTGGLSRSYYYSQYDVKQRIVSDVLETHTPFGITYVAPVFNTPPVS